MKNEKIKVIGTDHFMKEEEIRKEIDNFKPEIVMVELCNGRVSVMIKGFKQKEEFSLLGLISRSIRKKAKSEGIVYGSDMISAYKISEEKGVSIELIDRPLIETKIFFNAIPVKEKLHMVKELIKFSSKKITIENLINEVSSDKKVEEILKKMKKKCPNFFYYIIDSRDVYMINAIKSKILDNQKKKILIFVGKGHSKKIEESLKK